MKNALNSPFTTRFTKAVVMVSCLLLSSCAPSLVEAPEELPPFSDSLVRCTRWMDGSFMHERPSGHDGASRLEMNQARIWPSKTDGIWLYSELLVVEAGRERIMHQLIYRAQDDPSGGILIDSYRFPGDPSRFKGAWRDPELFDRVDSFMLKTEAGCAMRPVSYTHLTLPTTPYV